MRSKNCIKFFTATMFTVKLAYRFFLIKIALKSNILQYIDQIIYITITDFLQKVQIKRNIIILILRTFNLI